MKWAHVIKCAGVVRRPLNDMFGWLLSDGRAILWALTFSMKASARHPSSVTDVFEGRILDVSIDSDFYGTFCAPILGICVAADSPPPLSVLPPRKTPSRIVFQIISPDSIMNVYRRSLEVGLNVKDMLSGESVLALTVKEDSK